tara:strand:- start:4774 stop:6048 length:1275 start_codon:yes stop_codon:yes gene_type:complete
MNSILYKTELDSIKLKFRSNKINEFRKIIMSTYKMIDLSKIVIKEKIKKLRLGKMNIFDILLYLYKNKLINITSPDLIHIINQNKYNDFKEYVNNGLSGDLIDDINHLYQNNQIPEDILVRGVNKHIINTFVECNILDYILHNISHKYHYSIIYKNININLCIYGKKVSNTEFNDIITRIILLGLYKSIDESIDINVDLYMTPYKKNINNYIKNNNNILGPREINSGFSISNKILCVYRTEELNKVLVHELIHYLELDLDNVKFPNVSSYFNINPNTKFIRINEAYTEILAIMINTIINTPNIYNTTYILDYELTYSCYQVAKILHLSNFGTAYDFFYNKYDGQNKFKQNTSIFSYFILKTALLYNLDSFLDGYLNNRLNSHNFTEFILNQFSLDYINTINDFMNYIENNKSHMYYTLRMTCYN